MPEPPAFLFPFSNLSIRPKELLAKMQSMKQDRSVPIQEETNLKCISREGPGMEDGDLHTFTLNRWSNVC